MSDQFIDQLSRDLTATKPPMSPGALTLTWLLGSVFYVLVATAWLGPFRTGFADQLVQTPRFALEMALGIAAVICFAGSAFRDAVPGYDTRILQRAGWLLAIGWLSQFVVGFQFPVFEPSMLGKRDHCAFEAYVYSVPPVVFAIWMQQRRYPLRPMRAALYAALSAGMIPALVMQIACMYEPAHILKFHALPIVILSAVVALVFFGYQKTKGKS